MVQKTELTKQQKHNLYQNMKTRCYNKNYHKAKPDYKECSVCEEWLNDKQAFCEWVDENYYRIDGEPSVELDKDILVQGNKIYSPSTCIFAPRRINDLFIHSGNKKKNGLPLGVYKDNNNKYTVSCNITVFDKEEPYKKSVVFHGFTTPDEAAEVYRQHKKAEIIYIADCYKDRIPEKLYNAMLDWQC